MIRAALDVALILSITVWLVGLASDGAITVNHAAIALLSLVVFVGLARAAGYGLVTLAFRIGLPVAVLVAFVAVRGGGNYQHLSAVARPMFVLLIVLLGLYLIVFGALSNKSKR